MKLCACEGAAYWFPDGVLPRKPAAISGPFSTNAAAYWWLIAHLEEQFNPTRLAVWSEAMTQMGDGADVAHLMGLAMMVAAGHSRADVLRAAHPIRQSLRVDYRARAAGERAA